jgi:hypothetical protein
VPSPGAVAPVVPIGRVPASCGPPSLVVLIDRTPDGRELLVGEPSSRLNARPSSRRAAFQSTQGPLGVQREAKPFTTSSESALYGRQGAHGRTTSAGVELKPQMVWGSGSRPTHPTCDDKHDQRTRHDRWPWRCVCST